MIVGGKKPCKGKLTRQHKTLILKIICKLFKILKHNHFHESFSLLKVKRLEVHQVDSHGRVANHNKET